MLETLMKSPVFCRQHWLGRMMRYPLKMLPPTKVVHILTGSLRGKSWVVASAIHRCWLGLYERKKQRLISQEVRPNAVFYDVGANVGFYSLLASQLVNGGKVFAFEPCPKNLAYLKQHLVLNRVTNTEVLPLAVSDNNGTACFDVEGTGSMGHLSSEGSIAVQTATLDSLVEQGKILPPDYIKMDIEGGELAALRGASATFQNYRPVLFLATHGRAVHNECRHLLESWGYEWTDCESDPAGNLGEVVAKFRRR
jgi:FkbM family methyltransferase